MVRHQTRSAGHESVVRSETRRPVEAIIVNVVYFIFSVIIALLALRFALLLLGANEAAPFVQLIYALTAPLMAPFFAVFGRTVIEGSVFEWSALLAMVVYALLVWGLMALIEAVTPRYATSRVETVEEHRDEVADSRAADTYSDHRGTHAH
jgi:uncharacterized protein YggT (Ycf19 family)